VNHLDKINACCSTYFNFENFQFPNTLHGDASRSRAKRLLLFIKNLPIMNPHNKQVQRWNKFFYICCLVTVFVGPSYVFMLYLQKVWSPLYFLFKILHVVSSWLLIFVWMIQTLITSTNTYNNGINIMA